MPDKTLIVARDTALYMAASMVVVIGAVGLWTHWLGVVYPLSAMLMPDNALAVLAAGLGLLAMMLHWPLVQRIAGAALLLHMGYTLLHNQIAGSRLVGSSWVTGDVRIGTLASTVLAVVALCLLLGTARRYQRWLWAGVGSTMIGLGLLSVLRLFLPGGELSWTLPQASSPLLGTTLALLYGGAMLLSITGGSRPQPRMGWLALVVGLFGILLSCFAWYTLNWHYQANKQLQARHVLDNLQFNAEQVMEQQLQLMQRMAERLDATGSRLDTTMLNRDVENYLRDSPSLQEIGLQGADEWWWYWSRDTEAERWIQQQLMITEVSEWVSRHHDSPRLLSPDRTRRGMALIAIPVASMEQRLIAGMDLAVLFEHELRVQLANYQVRMLRGDVAIQELYSLEYPRLEVEYPVLAKRAIELPGGPSLTLEISPNSAPEMLQAVLIPGSVGMAGLLLSYLTAFSLGLGYQRQQDRRSLWESEQRYRSLFAYNPDAVFSIDAQGNFVSANATCTAITGLSLDSLIGSQVSCFVVPEAAERMQVHLDEAREGKAQRFEVWVAGKEDDQRLLDLTMLPIRVGGVTQGVYGIAKDVTERHHSETRLRVLNRSVEASVNGVVITDALQADHPIIYVNLAYS